MLAPSPCDWFSALAPAVTPLITLAAALIVGGLAFAGVNITAKNLRKIEHDKREHFDAGIRRQVRALLKRITAAMTAGLESGTLSPKRWKATYYVVRNRLMEHDVPAALQDDVAEAIYDALEAIRVARWSAATVEEDRKAENDAAIQDGVDPEDLDEYWSAERLVEMRAVYAKPCLALVKVWRCFGDDALALALETSAAAAGSKANDKNA